MTSVGGRIKTGARAPFYTACARCGHGSNLHKKVCLRCGCEKWVGGHCSGCDGYTFSAYSTALCRSCYAARNENRRLDNIARISTPEYKASEERRKDRKWWLKGKRTLTELRKSLKGVGA